MSNLTKEQKTALDEFSLISDVLAVPTMGKSLPAGRLWKLFDLDQKAAADLSRYEQSSAGFSSPVTEEQATSLQASPAATKSKTGESSVKNSPEQTGRK